MSGICGPQIIKNGLVLALDAADKNSYPGSGTTWTDLTNSRVNGSLVNGPTFSDSFGGSINFDGTNDTVDRSISSNISNNFCYDIWCRPNATHQIDTESTSGTSGLTGQRYLVAPNWRSADGGSGISMGTNGVSVYEHGEGYIPSLLVYQGTITLPTHVVVNYINKQPLLYLNGSLVRTGLTSLKSVVYLTDSQFGGHVYGYFSGQIYQIKLYNRSLSSSEILQNYNATKTRFGK